MAWSFDTSGVFKQRVMNSGPGSWSSCFPVSNGESKSADTGGVPDCDEVELG